MSEYHCGYSPTGYSPTGYSLTGYSLTGYSLTGYSLTGYSLTLAPTSNGFSWEQSLQSPEPVRILSAPK